MFVTLVLVALTLVSAGCGSSDGREGEDARVPDAAAPPDGADAGPVTGLGPFTLDDLEAGDTVRHPVVVVSGRVETPEPQVQVRVDESLRAWPVVEDRFRAVVRLSAGSNRVELRAGDARGSFELAYSPQTNPRFVRLVYIVASDGDGTFQAPAGVDNDQAGAAARIALGAELIQAYVARSLARLGHPSKTFRLLRDASGEPEVVVHRTSLTMDEALGMDGLDLWFHFHDELESLPDRAGSIDVAIMAFSRYDGSTGQLRGHTALGTDRLALFGSSSLHTWAASVDDLVTSWTDETRIDASSLHDDSVGRGTYWANYATTLGATLHELGHCLSLPHPASGNPIMARGFDHINRAFMLVEPPSESTGGIPLVTANDEPSWHPGHAARLRHHRFLELEELAYASDEPPTFSVVGDELRVESSNGVRQLSHHVGGNTAGFEHFADSAPSSFTVDLAAMRSMYGSGIAFHVSVIDDEGNISQSDELTL